MKTLIVVAALVAICLWPAIYNEQPLLFADTTAYVRGADAGFAKLLQRQGVWSPSDAAGDQGGRTDQLDARTLLPTVPGETVLPGRSIFYGALLYLSQLFGGRFWPMVFVQAATILLVIGLTLNTFGLFTVRCFAIISILLSLVTPIAFFVSYLMPDIFASVTILAIANLAVAGKRMSGWIMAAWACLLTVGLLFNTFHVLIAAGLLIAIVAGFLARRVPVPLKSIAIVGAAITVAVGGELGFIEVTKRLTGTTPLRPPYLTARLIADGPGYHYLLRSCPESGFELCKYTQQIAALRRTVGSTPLSDEFLWSVNPTVGVFSAVDPKTGRELSDEQYNFVKATLVFDPVGVLR